ncbi:MAG: outer membrane lipoprotein-sorting protein [Betaproteobacteria bacterium]|nr:outer membrane lipoprotein-sorting protein [Betaproteobacteria bacterium]
MRSRLPIVLARLFAVSVGCLPAFAFADAQADALSLLNRVYAASQRLSYTGIFIFQHGNQSETSRVTKIVEGALTREKLETLDGQPREVVRSGDDVVCYLPALTTVRIDKYSVQNSFLAMLPAQLKELLENYEIRRGGMERVAGYDCHVLTLEPRDNRRYGHKLWVDAQTGMLIKARTFDGRHEAMEQFTFSHLQIGGTIDREQVRSRFEGKTASWRVEDAAVANADLAQAGWTLRARPPGFRKILEMTRTLGGSAGVGHMVLSDGLAAISVFIETAGQRPSIPVMSRQGAINVYVRQLGAHRITVVGEAPVESVRSVAQAVEYRAPR